MQWLHSKIETITGAAAILAAASLASKVLGLARNRILAGTFGAGDTLDAYYAAFRIPDAIFQFVVIGALSAGFIPVFVELMQKTEDRRQKTELTQEKIRPPSSVLRSPADHWRVVSTLLNALLILLTLLTLLFVIFAPQLQILIAPGFSGDKLALAVKFARIMALGPLFLGISAVFSGILQSYRRFVIYALAPILYNVGIIIGALWLTKLMGVVGLAAGVVLGAILHMLVQFPTVRLLGFHWRAVCDLRDSAVRQIAWLSLPRVLGLAVTQINLFAITIFASKLSSGSLTVFNLSSDIQGVPLGLFAVSLSMAAFPAFSEFAARGDSNGFRRSFSSTARLILFLTVPFAILFLLLRAQIVRVLLGWGEFDWQDTIATADTLAFFSLSLFAQALINLVVRALFAIKDTVSPLLAGIVGVAVNIAAAFALREQFGVAGLALAYSIAMVVNLVVLWVILRIKMGSLDEGNIIYALFKISAAGLAMAVVVQMMKYIVEPYVNMQTGWGIFTQGAVAGMAGLAVFLIVALVVRSEEARIIKSAFVKRLFRSAQTRSVEIVE